MPNGSLHPCVHACLYTCRNHACPLINWAMLGYEGSTGPGGPLRRRCRGGLRPARGRHHAAGASRRVPAHACSNIGSCRAGSRGRVEERFDGRLDGRLDGSIVQSEFRGARQRDLDADGRREVLGRRGAAEDTRAQEEATSAARRPAGGARERCVSCAGTRDAECRAASCDYHRLGRRPGRACPFKKRSRRTPTANAEGPAPHLKGGWSARWLFEIRSDGLSPSASPRHPLAIPSPSPRHAAIDTSSHAPRSSCAGT